MEMKTKIKALRTVNGLTQAELGERLGISAKVISKWENGESLPQCEHLPNLADAFHISIDELFGRENNGKVDLKTEVRKFGFDHAYGISDMQKLVSYMVLGMKERENFERGWYTEQVLREISGDLERLIENDDPRPQFQPYYIDDSVVNFIRDDISITTMWHCDKEKFEKIMRKDYPPMRSLFAFLALDGADRIVRHLWSNIENKRFTLKGLMKTTDTDEATVRCFVDLLFAIQETTSEAIIGKETAVINGVETEIYHYYPGQMTKLFETVLMTAYLLMTEKGGCR